MLRKTRLFLFFCFFWGGGLTCLRGLGASCPRSHVCLFFSGLTCLRGLGASCPRSHFFSFFFFFVFSFFFFFFGFLGSLTGCEGLEAEGETAEPMNYGRTNYGRLQNAFGNPSWDNWCLVVGAILVFLHGYGCYVGMVPINRIRDS